MTLTGRWHAGPGMLADMNLLLLGGTRFLGRAIATNARGTGPAPDGIPLVRADRDEDEAMA